VHLLEVRVLDAVLDAVRVRRPADGALLRTRIFAVSTQSNWESATKELDRRRWTYRDAGVKVARVLELVQPAAVR